MNEESPMRTENGAQRPVTNLPHSSFDPAFIGISVSTQTDVHPYSPNPQSQSPITTSFRFHRLEYSFLVAQHQASKPHEDLFPTFALFLQDGPIDTVNVVFKLEPSALIFSTVAKDGNFGSESFPPGGMCREEGS